jgi:hypothetical protein
MPNQLKGAAFKIRSRQGDEAESLQFDFGPGRRREPRPEGLVSGENPNPKTEQPDANEGLPSPHRMGRGIKGEGLRSFAAGIPPKFRNRFYSISVVALAYVALIRTLYRPVHP